MGSMRRTGGALVSRVPMLWPAQTHMIVNTQIAPIARGYLFGLICCGVLLSHTVASAVPSPLWG